jgi:DNA-directed RNA polymerase subunit RPC12/RpoP
MRPPGVPMPTRLGADAPACRRIFCSLRQPASTGVAIGPCRGHSVIRGLVEAVEDPMHVFRCTSCGTPAYSATSLDRVGGDRRCEHCGGELEPAAQPRRFASSRRPEPTAAPPIGSLRRPA